MMSIFAWNMHGFNQPRKHNAVKYWIKEAKLRLGCLVETRVQEENFQQIFSATFQGCQYLHNYSHHRLGRIWVCWSEDVEVVPVLVSAQMITCWVKFKDTGDIFLASFIYGSNCMMERRDLWREMDTVARLVAAGTNPWILQGDFNVTKSAMEHSRFLDTAGENLAIREFQDIIRSCDLVDIPHTGPEFTWINSQEGNPIRKKLDRAMGNSSWISRFEQSHTLFEAGGVSDHSRMVTIVHDNPVENQKPFKFFTHVVSHPQFLEVVDQVWNSTAPLFHSRTALKKLQDKLKMLKSELRRLNRESFGDLPARVKVALEVLSDKQNNAMRNPCTTTFEEASDAWEHWHHLSGIEEQFFYQKSRVKWLDLGDRNTNFYHKTCQTRTSRNTIRRLITSDGRVLTELADIKKEAVDYYEGFLQEPGHLSLEDITEDRLSDLLDYHCSDTEAASLVGPVQAEEVKEALFSMPANKAPGPDGYPMEFYKAAWSVVGKDLVIAVQSFFLYGFMPRSTNATLLSLVPKITSAEKMSDFRPIACCNVIYKLISKIMAHRLKGILPAAIEQNQCAFVQGRMLLENVLLATELVKDYHKPQVSSRSAIKLDISKAFDTVKWTFIEAVLRAMRLPDMFVTWIMKCISTAMFSVSINGGLEGFFPSSRGIHQ